MDILQLGMILLLAYVQEMAIFEALITCSIEFLRKIGVDLVSLLMRESGVKSGYRIQSGKILYYTIYTLCGLGFLGPYSLPIAGLISAILIIFLLVFRGFLHLLGKRAEEDSKFREQLKRVFDERK